MKERSKSEKNPHSPQRDTHKRSGGGNTTTVTGETHGSKKASRVPAEARWDGAGAASLENSPGRA